MIPVMQRLILAVGVVFYFLILIYYLKRKVLELKYTLVWFAGGLVMALLVIFPKLLPICARIVHIESNMNALFLIIFAFLIMILISLTAIVSKSSARIRSLIQEMSILEKRIRELEEENKE